MQPILGREERKNSKVQVIINNKLLLKLNKIPAVKNTMEELKKQLEEAYGPININVTDGTYTDIPVENLKKVD